MRSIARRLRSLRASVHSATRHACHTSKAWVSISSFASVLTGVRWASAASHVPPISTSSGSAPPAPPAQFHEPGAPDQAAVGEPALGERQRRVLLLLPQQLGDVRGHRLGAVGDLGEAVAGPIARRRGGEVAGVLDGERDQLDVGAAQRQRFDRHPGERIPGRQRRREPVTTGGMTPTHAFATDSILPPDPDDLEVLHDREYRVRAYRAADDRLLIRGAVRDQKPPGMYVEGDPDPLTVHHMQVELEVAFPSLEIVEGPCRPRDPPQHDLPAHRGPLRRARRPVDRPGIHQPGP